MTGPGAKRAQGSLHAGNQQDGATSSAGSPPKTAQGLGFDGAGDDQYAHNHNHLLTGRQFPKTPFGKDIKPTDINRRLELPPEAYILNGEFITFQDLPSRPSFGSEGKQIDVRVNQYQVLDWPQKTIYQYDITINLDGGVENRGLYKAVWNSRVVQNELAKTSNFWLWNGDKIAWSDCQVKEVKKQVNLDEMRGRTPKPNVPPNMAFFHMRQTTRVEMAVIKAYLQGTIPFDNSILEAINFLDHVMRITPSKKFLQIKRSYFTPNTEMRLLDDTIQAMKGVYASMRLTQNSGNGTGLSVNVDVANGTFWSPLMLHLMARNITKHIDNRNNTYEIFARNCQPKMNGNILTFSDTWKELRKLHRIKFSVNHRNKQGNEKLYTLDKFLWEIGPDGKYLNAKTKKFNILVPGTKNQNPPQIQETISVYDYFRKRYNITLVYPYLPLVQSVKGGLFPMEVCKVEDNQRYMFKTNPAQTAAMIKFAVTIPSVRKGAIAHGVSKLDWARDPELGRLGIRISSEMTKTKARLIPPPEIKFATSKVAPGTKGKWDLRGHKFLRTPTEPLARWGVAIMEECTDEATVKNFLKVFTQQYVQHGGNVADRNPLIIRPARSATGDVACELLWKSIGDKHKKFPQILFFIMGERHSAKYERIKKSADCRFGVVSQVLNAAHVARAQPQYCSNVLMKVNAKLGGTTSAVAGPDSKTPFAKFFPRGPTIILGADVSHPTPNSPQASMAALSMSADMNAARYLTAVETNGYGREMISTNNLETMLIPLLQWWTNVHKVGPVHIYYFRDGVSEGQYQQVLQMEVRDIKALIKKRFEADVKMTVIVCSKRHRIRMFPEGGAGDAKGNPHPGTIVERDVTHPTQYDFYLNSHSAIQGTARPVHYHVLLDEMGVPVDHLQKMIYHQCYQYIRSTTPVSLHPAVYYAHLAASRARSHESYPTSDGPRGGQKFTEQDQQKRARDAHNPELRGKAPSKPSMEADARPLLEFGLDKRIPPEIKYAMKHSMWYI